MVQPLELLKTIAVAAAAILHAVGCCPVPTASIVTLALVQALSLLSHLVDRASAPTSKLTKLNSSGEPVGSLAKRQMARGFLEVCAAAFLERAALRNATWLVLACLIIQARHAAGLAGSSLPVLLLTCCVGAACRCLAAALTQPKAK